MAQVVGPALGVIDAVGNVLRVIGNVPMVITAAIGYILRGIRAVVRNIFSWIRAVVRSILRGIGAVILRRFPGR